MTRVATPPRWYSVRTSDVRRRESDQVSVALEVAFGRLRGYARHGAQFDQTVVSDLFLRERSRQTEHDLE